MKLNDYQEKAESTDKYPYAERLTCQALGMNGEAGEVADKIKKIFRDTNVQRDEVGKVILTDEQKQEIAKEIGDVLWYVATLSNTIGYSLEDVAKMNLDKLASRQKRNVISGSGDNSRQLA